jgi:hypothetical protein
VNFSHIPKFGILGCDKLFPLSLLGTTFNWFTSLAPNSVNTWVEIEEKFHEYFYNGEAELKLSDLTTVRQKYTETIAEYIKRFRERRNKCYSLTVREKILLIWPLQVYLHICGRRWREWSLWA